MYKRRKAFVLYNKWLLLVALTAQLKVQIYCNLFYLQITILVYSFGSPL
jgi:hypothetical protein